MTFIVKYDFAKCQPTWTPDLKRLFGENNEGFPIRAENIEQVKLKLPHPPYNVNPWYVTIEQQEA